MKGMKYCTRKDDCEIQKELKEHNGDFISKRQRQINLANIVLNKRENPLM